MQKTIVIDGKEVQFATSGAVPIRYKKQFGRDFFADIASLAKSLPKGQVEETQVLETLNIDVFYNVAWIFAKTADKEIAGLEDWLDSFSQFPIIEIISDIQELLMHTFQRKKK